MISIKDLTHIYERQIVQLFKGERKIIALKQINLNIKENSVSLILGPSGSGKTTLLEIISTSLPPTAGLLQYLYKSEYIEPFITERATLQQLRREFVGYQHQILYNNFLEDFSLLENIKILKTFNSSLQNTNKEMTELLNKVGLVKRHSEIPIKRLSGGEKQRVSLVFLLLRKSRIFILDEPTSFLDEKNKLRVISLIEEYVTLGHTFIIASHDSDFVRIANNLYYLESGKLVQDHHTIESISNTYSKKIQIPGKKPTNSFELTIPDIFFNQLTTNQVYYMEQNNNKIKLSLPTKTQFKTLDKENLVYIEEKNPLIMIPKEFRHLTWFTSQIMWIIDENGLSIEFKIK